jgi:hypothetical protein
LAKRSLEFILGLLGGIFGILASLVLVNPIMFVSSVIGLVAAFFVDSHRKLSGAIMTASGTIGIFLAVLGEPSGNLILMIAGIITLLRKPPKSQPSRPESGPTEDSLPTGGKFCINCRAQLPTNAGFCDECGASQN